MAGNTIAVIGQSIKDHETFMYMASKEKVRLLYVVGAAEKFKRTAPIEEWERFVEVDYINCAKEGCWEADIIVVNYPEAKDPALFEKIKEVATQKIVLVISQEKDEETSYCQEILSSSKIVKLILNEEKKTFIISGNNVIINNSVTTIMEGAGYKNL